MNHKKVPTYAGVIVALLAAITSMLLAYPLRSAVSRSALAVEPQCPGGKPPPCERPHPTPRPRRSQRPTARPTPKPTSPKSLIELAWIAPGRFLMGADNGRNDQIPVHLVTIKEGFYMGKYEVTQAQWKAVMGSSVSHFDGDNLPMESVSWADANDFLAKLSLKDSRYRYRLPTEAEWEYAARAGTTGNFAGELDAMTWFNKNSDERTHPVGTKRPNGFGLFDMQGNVWEWCQDWYHGDFTGAPADESAWLNGGDQKLRVVRGGSYLNDASLCRSAMRLGFDPNTTSRDTGFRVVAIARP